MTHKPVRERIRRSAAFPRGFPEPSPTSHNHNILKALQVLLAYLTVGALVAFLVHLWTPQAVSTTAAIPFEVPAHADPSEVDRYRDEAIAMIFARQLGWYQTDPLVRARLVQNMRFAEVAQAPQIDETTIVERAITIGMHEHDPVIRRRMMERFTTALEVTMPPPTSREIDTTIRTYSQRFGNAEQRRFETLFWGDPRRTTPDVGTIRFDPVPPLLRFGSEVQLQRAWGTGFGQAVFRCSPETWCGPIRSVFGVHWVRVTEVVPPSDGVANHDRAWATEKIRAEKRPVWIRKHMDRLTKRLQLYPVVVQSGVAQ